MRSRTLHPRKDAWDGWIVGRMECDERRGRGDAHRDGGEGERMASAVYGTNLPRSSLRPWRPIPWRIHAYHPAFPLRGWGRRGNADRSGWMEIRSIGVRTTKRTTCTINSRAFHHVQATMKSLGCRSKANRKERRTVRSKGEAMEGTWTVVDGKLTSGGGIVDGSDRDGRVEQHEAHGDVQSPVRQRTRVRTP